MATQPNQKGEGGLAQDGVPRREDELDMTCGEIPSLIVTKVRRMLTKCLNRPTRTDYCEFYSVVSPQQLAMQAANKIACARTASHKDLRLACMEALV